MILFCRILFYLLVGGQAAVLRNNVPQSSMCGYDACPKIHPTKLNVHLVPHTHDDVGWLKTIDEYFYGLKPEIQRANVRAIIDSVIESLRHDPKRKFIYVETAFLWKWWALQNETIRAEVRSFINDGRLEIIGGAWSMNDEATTHYQSIIDQSTWGFRRLNDTFGGCARPKIGWQIDPFGHSRVQASLFAEFGFDGMFVGRLDYQDRNQRLRDKTTEFVWQSSPNLGRSADLFASILYDGYYTDNVFCFDVHCAFNELSPNFYRTKATIQQFYTTVTTQARSYRTNNVIFPMGRDFSYEDAEMYFNNLDHLISYMNNYYGEEVNVFYSTPSCYLKSVHEAQETWPTKTDDFFPYSTEDNGFWAGYFTSRPTLKYFERLGNNFLQVTKQLTVLAGHEDSDDLQLFRETMGVMQHHDAITGTAKQAVTYDYARMLTEAMVGGEKLVSNALVHLSARDNYTKHDANFTTCLLLNISLCEIPEDYRAFILTLYNPQSHPLTTYVRIPVTGKGYYVHNHLGKLITTQLLPIPVSVVRIPGRISSATRELVFHVNEVPALGYQSFHIMETSLDEYDDDNVIDEVTEPTDVSSIGGELYDISVNKRGSVVIKWKQMDMSVTQSFHYYGNTNDCKPSGAYIFQAEDAEFTSLDYSGFHQFYQGPLVEELHITINDYVSQIVRVYRGEEKIEFDWIVGPIPVDDKTSKEVITQYSSNLASDGVFYTDSNGREMIKRTRDLRPTPDVQLDDRIAGNYYPVTSKISLIDEKKNLKMSVLTDRSQGGSSAKEGQLELMLHRRLLYDDNLGVSEALNEEAYGVGLVARGVHHLVASDLNDLDGTAAKEKSIALSLSLKPWTLLNTMEGFTRYRWNRTYSMEFSGLRQKLPPNVQILTLEPWKDNRTLLRLEHLYEVDEAKMLSSPVIVNIASLFAGFDVTEVRETTLGANEWIEDAKHFSWNTKSTDELSNVDNQVYGLEIANGDINVTLAPKQIRTFIIQMKPIPPKSQEESRAEKKTSKTHTTISPFWHVYRESSKNVYYFKEKGNVINEF